MGTASVQPRGWAEGPNANRDIRITRRECNHSAKPTKTNTIPVTIKGMVSISVEDKMFVNIMITFLPGVVAQAKHGQKLKTEENQPSDCERFEIIYG